MVRSSLKRAAAMSLALAIAAGVAGCGIGDVEMNGKIFDAMGVSPSTMKKAGEARVEARNGLVVPPDTGSLPEPGSGRAPEAEADLAFINDPDRQRNLDRSELARKQAEFCKVAYEDPKARGDNSVDGVSGPAGPCRPSLLTSIKKWNKDDE